MLLLAFRGFGCILLVLGLASLVFVFRSYYRDNPGLDPWTPPTKVACLGLVLGLASGFIWYPYSARVSVKGWPFFVVIRDDGLDFLGAATPLAGLGNFLVFLTLPFVVLAGRALWKRSGAGPDGAARGWPWLRGTGRSARRQP